MGYGGKERGPGWNCVTRSITGKSKGATFNLVIRLAKMSGLKEEWLRAGVTTSTKEKKNANEGGHTWGTGKKEWRGRTSVGKRQRPMQNWE